MTPELAIVIPAYNEQKLIGDCLAAVVKEVKRSGVNAEIVVVDNNSKDRTGEIARSFEGVKVVLETEKGLVHARHAGFVASTAPLVANIDGDTIMPEGWITKVMESFRADDRLVALSGPYYYYDLSAWQRFLVAVFYGAAYLLYLVSRFVIRSGSMVQGGNFVIRRDAWISVGGFDRSIAFYGEDTDVAVRLNRVGKVRWTWGLPMWTSGRRLAEEGIVRTGLDYTVNFFWVTFAGKPKTTEYSDIRRD
jgi:glycosyltransferase involved in cell wall biosynthesis